jgi:zinc protease
MQAHKIIIIVLLLLSGCATLPDPRTLSQQPVTTSIPLAPKLGLAYTMPGTGLDHILMLFPGGTYLDPRGKEGAMEILASGMLKGGSRSLTPAQMEETLGRYAIDISIAPQREYTLVRMTCLPDVVEKAVPLLLEILSAPRLDERRIEIERKIFADSLRRDEEEASTIAFDTYRSHYYRGDPRAYKPTQASITDITGEDLLSLHQRVFTYKPILGIIGTLPSACSNQLSDAFSTPWTPAPIGPAPDPEFGTFAATAKERQGVLLMAHNAPAMNAPDYAACVVADHLIGSGGFSSLLVKEVRTKQGLAYSTDSFYQARPNWGIFGLIVITEPRELDKAKSAVDTVLGQIRRGLSSEDVAWAKQAVMNSHAVPYNTPLRIITRSMDLAFYNIPEDFDAAFIAQVAALTPEAVQAAALKLISGKWVEVQVNSGNLDSLGIHQP